ncbi:hypothetical protein MTR_1g080830 [Medicago truncatula]|uniref:Uncharacterized protein n=1 Tax=Medicago truncatula TaxID=3880 RepID=A0A072VLY3_MEDTR|nr:hypothetical protein MTR_1g080830 [Medicago truncatula]
MSHCFEKLRKCPTFSEVPGTTPLGVAGFCHDYKTFVDNKFTNECVYAVYNIHFDVVHHQTYWPNYEGLKVVPNKSMRRAKKGRPPITCIRTEMDDVETERRCGVCRMLGHSRKDCINIRHQ